MPLTLYEVVLQDSEGNTWEGQVVTHLSLPIWLDWKHYRLLEGGGFYPATFERTHLLPKGYLRISGTHVIPGRLQELLTHSPATSQQRK